MSERLSWINNHKFLIKELWAPFHVDNDIDYYDSLSLKYRLLYNSAKQVGADSESLKIIKKNANKVKEALRMYYVGKISTSHTIIKNLVKSVLDCPLAVEYINSSYAIPGFGEEIQFYRARTSDRVKVFPAKEMLHIPFEKRGKTGNYRFSIPGIPCLYIGNTTYACWIELGYVPDFMFNVSPVLLDGTQRILNLAVMTRYHLYLKDYNKEFVHCWLKLLILMIATSYVIDEKDRFFKSEYIISQSIMLGCKELGLDGVAYFSKRVSDELFAFAAINIALFTNYKKGMNYSSICNHVKVGNSFNYSMYKQLGREDREKDYLDYHIAHTGGKIVIGSYKNQFSYFNTEFSAFDKFLFGSWDNKVFLKYGNALDDSEERDYLYRTIGFSEREYPFI